VMNHMRDLRDSAAGLAAAISLTVVAITIFITKSCERFDETDRKVDCSWAKRDFHDCLDKLPEWNKNGDMGRRECERLRTIVERLCK